MPQTPRPTVPTLGVLILALQFQERMKRCRKHCSHFSGIQLGNERDLRIGIFPGLRIVRMQEGNAGTHDQLGFGKIGRQLTEMLNSEGLWKWVVDVWEADLFPCFAAGCFEGGLGEGVSTSWMN